MMQKSEKPFERTPIIALGTMTYGAQTSASDADRMLRMFLDEGHRWVDTAFMYTEGRSEMILGRLLKGRMREKAFLATKAYPDKLGKGKPRGLTPGSVRGQLETSLRRLRMDHVDLFYLHAPDNRTPLEVTLAACQDLAREGKTRTIGLSNYASWQAAEAALICARNGWRPPVIYQGMYNAVTRDVERECIPSCRHFGLRFIAYNPLAGGLLTGKHADPSAIPATGRFSGEYYRDRYWKGEYFAAVGALQQAARKNRIPLAAASLRWLLHHSRSDGLILGASQVEHLRENLAACRKGPLPPPFVRAFDQVWERTKPVCQRYFRD
jgi:aflatoxin B1 aldehyde reductase